MSRKARIIVIIIAIFVGMGIYKNPEQWGGNVNQGINGVETGAERGGTFLNTVLDGQFSE